MFFRVRVAIDVPYGTIMEPLCQFGTGPCDATPTRSTATSPPFQGHTGDRHTKCRLAAPPRRGTAGSRCEDALQLHAESQAELSRNRRCTRRFREKYPHWP